MSKRNIVALVTIVAVLIGLLFVLREPDVITTTPDVSATLSQPTFTVPMLTTHSVVVATSTTAPRRQSTSTTEPGNTSLPQELSPSQIATIWSGLTKATSSFFDTGDLGVLDRAIGSLETKYASSRLQLAIDSRQIDGSDSPEKMIWKLKAWKYSECRVVDMLRKIFVVDGC